LGLARARNTSATAAKGTEVVIAPSSSVGQQSPGSLT
jgi:hypothetical protein